MFARVFDSTRVKMSEEQVEASSTINVNFRKGRTVREPFFAKIS